MINTYINDNQSIPYPFFGDAELPFPMRCIVGLGICVYGAASDAVYASSVIIRRTEVQVSLCRGSEVLGTAVASTTGDTVWTQAGTTKTFGYVLVGEIQEQDLGTYNGTFYIDPSCITYMPANVYGRYASTKVDGTQRVMPESFSVQTAGILEMELTGSTAAVTVNEFDQTVNGGTASVYELTTVTTPVTDKVKSINGVSFVITGTYSALVLDTNVPDMIDISVDGTVMDGTTKPSNPRKIVTVTLTGGTLFPNCYGSDDEVPV